ncbi:MAG: hypothetical protein LAP21_09100 [Acidobacteriia bacterium]|nr:hypothetical protein [Terriglobia bacterium]
MTVLDVEPGPHFRPYGCFKSFSGPFDLCGMVTHPPRLESGQSLTFKRLLKGYSLGPGSYTLRVKGKPPLEEMSSPLATEGNRIAAELPFQVSVGTEVELRQVFAPWLEQAETGANPEKAIVTLGWADEQQKFARDAITESAPAFLEGFALGFVESDPKFTIAALEKMNTFSARRALVQMFEQARDDRIRHEAAGALARLAAPEQFDFFAGLTALPDVNLQDEGITALGRIGGWRAVQALAGIQTKSGRLNESINDALGVSKSPAAVPVLIERYSRAGTRAGVCNALTTLTHYSWCANPRKDQVQYWKKWWAQHESTAYIYGDDDCNGAYEAKPLV